MDRMCENYPAMYLGLLAAKKEFDTINPSFKPKIVYAQKLYFERNNIHDSKYIQKCEDLNLDSMIDMMNVESIFFVFAHKLPPGRDYCVQIFR